MDEAMLSPLSLPSQKGQDGYRKEVKKGPVLPSRFQPTKKETVDVEMEDRSNIDS